MDYTHFIYVLQFNLMSLPEVRAGGGGGSIATATLRVAVI